MSDLNVDQIAESYFHSLSEGYRGKSYSVQAHQRLKTSILELSRAGVQFLTPQSPGYPDSFRRLDSPPQFLNALGDLSCLQAPLVAVVGSRNPSVWTLQWIEEELSQLWKDAPHLVSLSGGAVGVDQAVHRSSLRVGARSVAVLPSGLKCPYPRSFEALQEILLAKGGCILSEYGPHHEMRRHHFVRRNELIAALSSLVLVCDAKIPSGTWLTARHALQLGKTLLVLPSHPRDAGARGNLELLCEGANPVRDAQDVRMYTESEISIKHYR